MTHTTSNTRDGRRKSRSERNRLVEQELSLARRIAADYRHRGIDTDDLVQVAFLALVKAAERFDPDAGTRFSVFASLTINGEIKRYFRDQGWSVRPPRTIQEDYLAVRKTQDHLVQELGRVPSVEEVADRAGIDADRVLVAMTAQDNYRAKRIRGSSRDDSWSAMEPVSVEVGFEDVCARVDVSRILDVLSERDQRIVQLRYGSGLTQSAIARDIGVSQVQVSRLLGKITETLRDEALREDDAQGSLVSAGAADPPR